MRRFGHSPNTPLEETRIVTRKSAPCQGAGQSFSVTDASAPAYSLHVIKQIILKKDRRLNGRRVPYTCPHKRVPDADENTGNQISCVNRQMYTQKSRSRSTSSYLHPRSRNFIPSSLTGRSLTFRGHREHSATMIQAYVFRPNTSNGRACEGWQDSFWHVIEAHNFAVLSLCTA